MYFRRFDLIWRCFAIIQIDVNIRNEPLPQSHTISRAPTESERTNEPELFWRIYHELHSYSSLRFFIMLIYKIAFMCIANAIYIQARTHKRLNVNRFSIDEAAVTQNKYAKLFSGGGKSKQYHSSAIVSQLFIFFLSGEISSVEICQIYIKKNCVLQFLLFLFLLSQLNARYGIIVYEVIKYHLY